MEKQSSVAGEDCSFYQNTEEAISPSLRHFIKKWWTNKPSDDSQENPPENDVDELQHFKTTKTTSHSSRRHPRRTITIRETRIETLPAKAIKTIFPEILQSPICSILGQSPGMSCPGLPHSPRQLPEQYVYDDEDESEESEDEVVSPHCSPTYVRYDDMSYGNLNLTPPSPQRPVAAVPPRCVAGPAPQPANVTMGSPRRPPLAAFQSPLRPRPVGVCRPMQQGTGRPMGVAQPMVRQGRPVAVVGPMQRASPIQGGGLVPAQGYGAVRPAVPIRPFGANQVEANRVAVVAPRVVTPPPRRPQLNQTYVIPNNGEETMHDWSGSLSYSSSYPSSPGGSYPSSPGSIPSTPGSPRLDPYHGIMRPCYCDGNRQPRPDFNATYPVNPNATYNVTPNTTYVDPNSTYTVSGYDSFDETGYDEFQPSFHSSMVGAPQHENCDMSQEIEAHVCSSTQLQCYQSY